MVSRLQGTSCYLPLGYQNEEGCEGGMKRVVANLNNTFETVSYYPKQFEST